MHGYCSNMASVVGGGGGGIRQRMKEDRRHWQGRKTGREKYGGKGMWTSM